MRAGGGSGNVDTEQGGEAQLDYAWVCGPPPTQITAATPMQWPAPAVALSTDKHGWLPDKWLLLFWIRASALLISRWCRMVHALVRAYEGALEAKKQAAEEREREEQCVPQRRTRSDFADVVQVSPLS